MLTWDPWKELGSSKEVLPRPPSLICIGSFMNVLVILEEWNEMFRQLAGMLPAFGSRFFLGVQGLTREPFSGHSMKLTGTGC